ncbi:MAG: hypothetical protein WDZ59_17480 [Pirellulales bacterium]
MRLPLPPCRREVAMTVCFAILLPTLGGCEHDPAKTVNLQITGVSDEATRDEIQETLEGMTDGSSHFMTTTWSGETMRVKLSPVTDVEAFTRKINFGEVVEVDDRTVKVQFVD